MCSIAVCGASQRAAVAGCHLVRGIARIPSEEDRRPDEGGPEAGLDVSHQQFAVPHGSGFGNGSADEEALCEIHLTFILLHDISL